MKQNTTTQILFGILVCFMWCGDIFAQGTYITYDRDKDACSTVFHGALNKDSHTIVTTTVSGVTIPLLTNLEHYVSRLENGGLLIYNYRDKGVKKQILAFTRSSSFCIREKSHN